MQRITENLESILSSLAKASNDIIISLQTQKSSQTKADDSVAIAEDLIGHQRVKEIFEPLGFKVISEEDAPVNYTKDQVKSYFIQRVGNLEDGLYIFTDPFDGSKEGKKWSETKDDKYSGFTMNVGLVRKRGNALTPVAGFVTQPARNKIFWSVQGREAFLASYDEYGNVNEERVRLIVGNSTTQKVCLADGKTELPSQISSKHQLAIINDVGISRVLQIATNACDLADMTSKNMFEMLSGSYAILSAAGGRIIDANGRNLSFNPRNLHDKIGFAGKHSAITQNLNFGGVTR